MVVNKTKDIDTKNKSDSHWFIFWFDLTNWITQSVNHPATEMEKTGSAPLEHFKTTIIKLQKQTNFEQNDSLSL